MRQILLLILMYVFSCVVLSADTIILPTDTKVYESKLVRVIDGDTIIVNLHLGVGIQSEKTIRFRGFDAEEMRGDNILRKQKAIKTKELVSAMITNADSLYIQTENDSVGKYGRLLGDVWILKDGKITNLNLYLIENGYQKSK